MCVECVPPQLVDLTPHDFERFFRVIGGRRCNNLNHRYVMPADEDELRVRRRVLLLFRPAAVGLGMMALIAHLSALRAVSQDDPICVRE